MTQHFKDKLEVNPIGITVPLVDYIPDSEGIISYQARVSNANNQLDFHTADKLLSYCAREGHWSIFDMANLVLEIKAPRDISRQVLRHSSAKFQEFCVAEGTLVHTMTASGSLNKVPIEDLYKRFKSKQYWDMSSKLVRVYDENSGRFVSSKIKEVFETGVKPVYKMELGNRKVITSTLDHKFLTYSGFKRLEDISKGEIVGCYSDLFDFEPSYSPVKSIEYVGELQTYDLEVEHDSHNYVADGIVTHNSQRYADVTEDMFCLRGLRLQDTKNRQNSIDGHFNESEQEEWYNDQEEVITKVNSIVSKWRSREVAKECTRVFMPEGLTMSKMYMNATVRTWIHYTGLRSKRGETQSEHCDVSDKCREFLLQYFPSLCKVLEDNDG